FRQICQAVRCLAESRRDVLVVYPVHLNPNVQAPVREILDGVANIKLLPPLDYLSFVACMRRSYLLLTDSGGIQEEGPSLGKPILVLREKTERPEALLAGTARLVGTDPEKIVAETTVLLDHSEEYRRRTSIYNPYGDGFASRRIADAILAYFGESAPLNAVSHSVRVATP